MYAEVVLTNERSLQLFRKLGWQEKVSADGICLFERTGRSKPILNGLKLWTKNVESFEASRACIEKGRADFIELYHVPGSILHPQDIRKLSGLPITIHTPNSHGFHECIFGAEQLRIWDEVRRMADLFASDVIVLHPGRDHTVESFFGQLEQIDDSRIYIENMAGVDLTGKKMFGQRLDDLARIALRKPICFDLEKATKAAAYQNIDYRMYINEAIGRLWPRYFHLSGGDSKNPMDQHLHLWEGSIDISFIRDTLEKWAGHIGEPVRLVFETPKSEEGVENDLKNIAFFQGEKNI